MRAYNYLGLTYIYIILIIIIVNLIEFKLPQHMRYKRKDSVIIRTIDN